MFGKDLVAGLTTGVVLVAQAVAYASLAGLPPAAGLYGALVAPLIYGAIGRSDVLAAGPTAISSLLVGAALAGEGDGALAHAALLAAMVGTVQVIALIVRLDRLADFVTPNVLRGFLAGAALRIVWSQAPTLVGWSGEWGDGVDTATAMVGGTALLCLLIPLPKKLQPFGALRTVAVMALFTLASFLLGWTVAQVGALPEGLPVPGLPEGLEWASVGRMAAPALVIGLLSFIEGIGAAGARPQELEPRRELAGLGLANWGSAIVGGYPVSGGLSRTAVNARAGATSRWANVFASAVVALVLLAGGAVLGPLPESVLAAVVTAGVLSLIDHERIRKSTRRERWVLAATFLPTLLLGVGPGVATGAVVAALTRRYGEWPGYMAQSSPRSSDSSGPSDSSDSSESDEPPPNV